MALTGQLDRAPTRRPARPGSWRGWLSRTSPRTRVLLATGLLTGIVCWQVTGWVLAVPAVPLAIVGLPWLLSAGNAKVTIGRLEALEEWTRSLAGVVHVGVGLEEALAASIRSTPTAIHGEVARLVARLRARWNTEEAIRAFADDLDDATGDLIAANLILAARRRGHGLADVLQALARTVADDVRNRRQIEADRAKPRATARWVTAISLVVLAVLTFSGDYVRPYGTPIGQVVLAGLLTAYVACLVWLKRMATGRPAPRILRSRS
ncbi:type II secretion system F family protein [Isoptericola sp. NPDC019482]|uniref:type II secretion system F family protein n=1 Tax=Isoptericola sp. NPDC019482 TaxID=3154688 RepID=UPI0034799ACD